MISKKFSLKFSFEIFSIKNGIFFNKKYKVFAGIIFNFKINFILLKISSSKSFLIKSLIIKMFGIKKFNKFSLFKLFKKIGKIRIFKISFSNKK